MKSFLFALAALLVTAGCASTQPPELQDAHTAFDRASHGQAAQLAPADLHAAKEQLATADQAFDDNGDSQETRDLAYAAQRRAELAEARARTIAANQEESASESQYRQMKDNQARLTSAELTTAEQQLAQERQALAASEQQRGEAERRARQAAADLSRIASVKEESRGMVITLSGSVLFASGKHELLPQAQAKLSHVSDVLARQDPDAKIVVDGFTDSQGSNDVNMRLSQQRADAVRSYLVGHGIAADRITAEGKGPTDPVADNKTAEGRADNRRVEIVVQPSQGKGESGAGTTSP
jgi:outer membrane protein OmpA-like peptidoglycan-associated protein